MTRTPEHVNPPAQKPGDHHDHKPGTHSDHELKQARHAVRELKRVIKSPCNRPPIRPDVPRISAFVHEAKTDLTFTGKMRWNDVTTDTSGQDITLDQWEAIAVACGPNGTPLDTDAEGPTHPITAATVTNQIATITIGDNHQYDPGDIVKITNVSPNAYNGYWVVKDVPSNSKFTFNIGQNSANGSSFGNVFRTSGMHLRRSIKLAPSFMPIKAATAVGQIATFTTRSPHHFEIGDNIAVIDVTPVAYDGVWNVTNIPSPNQFKVNLNSSPADATKFGKAVDTEDAQLQLLMGVLPRPKTWYWKGRVRCKSSDGCWSAWSPWTQPFLPWTGANPKPPTPTYSFTPITFDTKGKGRDSKVRLKFTYDEVGPWDYPGGDRQDDMDSYIVQLDRSDDGVNWDSNSFPVHTVVRPARDGDADSTRTSVFHNIRRHYWYRCRVRTKDRYNRKGDWSAWTPAALPFDDNRPPAPLNVETWDAQTDRVAVAWDDPQLNVPVRGSASVVSGNVVVNGTNSKWLTEIDEGSTVAFSGAPTTYYTVKRVGSDTQMTLTSTYNEATNGSRNVFVVDDDPDVAFYEVQIARKNQVDTSTTPHTWNTIYARDRTRGTKISFKVQDSDKTQRFYARVRTVDAAHNRSQWIPAWIRSQHGGLANNSAITTGDDGGIAVPIQGDGSPPASSPGANAQGYLGYIAVWWAAVTNADPVTYDIHISRTSGFTPTSATLVGATDGLSATIIRYADGTALVPGTNYYVRLVARDYDGNAAAGAQAGPIQTLAQITDATPPSVVSPTPTVVPKSTFLTAFWSAAVGNADPVSYEVHVSTSNNFTVVPGASATLYAITTDTQIDITRLPPIAGGGTALVPGTTYYVKLLVRDFDGPTTAGAGTQGAAIAGGQPSDGLAPSTSPAITSIVSGVGFLVANWTPFILGAPRDATHNPDPVTYEVYAGTVNPPTTKVGETDGGSFFVRSLAAAAPLVYGTTYYVGVKAKDNDGIAALGTVASGSPLKVSSPDIAANAVTADAILAGSVTADKLAANLIVSTKIVGSRFGNLWDQNNRVEIDGAAGVSLVLDTGGVGGTETYPVRLPIDGTSPSFKGGIDADDINVSGAATLLGAANQIAPGATLQLAGGIATPQGALAATPNWPTQRLAEDADVNRRYRGLDYSTVGGSGGTTKVFYSLRRNLDTGDWTLVEFLASDMSVNRESDPIISDNDGETLDVCHSGSNIFVVKHVYDQQFHSFGIPEFWTILTIPRSSLDVFSGTEITVTNKVNNKQPGILNDGTNICLISTATHGATSKITLNKYTTALAFVSSVDLDAAVTVSAPDTELYGGAFQLNAGVTGYHIGMYDSTQSVTRNRNYVFDASTLVEVATSRWNNPDANGGSYLTYDGTNSRFISMKESGQGVMYRHSDVFAYTSDGNPVHFGYTWYDSDTTGTTAVAHETTISTRITSVTWQRRSFMNVTWPTPPVDSGGIDDVNNVRVYAVQAATPPSSRLRADYFLQATVANVPPNNTGLTLSSLSSTAGTNTLGAFPGVSNPGKLVSGSGRLTVAGDDTFRSPVVGLRCYRNGDNNLTVGTPFLWTPVVTDFEYLPPGLAAGAIGGPSNANPSDFVVPTGWAGWWRLLVQLRFAAGSDTSGRTQVDITKNAGQTAGGGTLVARSQRAGSNNAQTQSTEYVGVLGAGDYLEVNAFTAGTARDLIGNTTAPTESFAVWMYLGD